MTLTELRDALAKAAGPDRELDFAIMAALFDPTRENNYWSWQSGRPQGSPKRPATEYWRHRAPVSHRQPRRRRDARAGAMDSARMWQGWLGDSFEGYARTPQIAMCLARIEYELAKAATPPDEAAQPAR